jgi:hypothetical protein
LERETGFEPATSTLARLHSTAELFPHLVLENNVTVSVPRARETLNFGHSWSTKTALQMTLKLQECATIVNSTDKNGNNGRMECWMIGRN